VSLQPFKLTNDTRQSEQVHGAFDRCVSRWPPMGPLGDFACEVGALQQCPLRRIAAQASKLLLARRWQAAAR
jgi:hypothetical protein